MLDALKTPIAPRPDATRSGSSGATAPESAAETTARTIHDMVELSNGAQEIVNLQRGNTLAEEARTRTVDKDYASFLSQAMADIKRITGLFNTSFMSFFRGLRDG